MSRSSLSSRGQGALSRSTASRCVIGTVTLMSLLQCGLATSTAADAPTLTATPDVASTSPTAFTLSWSGVVGASGTDWVAQYCVGETGPDGFGPWSYTNGAASGSLVLTVADPLAQAPCPRIVFAYYRDPAPYRLVAVSNAVAWNTSGGGGGGTAPRHVRLAYGADPRTSMHLSFTTDNGELPALVQLGTAPGAFELGNVSAAAAVTYAAADSCGAPRAWSPPGYFHHALLTGLTPATRYYARAVQGASVGAETSFVSGKALGADVPVRAIVYADMSVSSGDGAASTAARVGARARDADFLLHVGDLSYGEGDAGVWETWMSLIAPVSSVLPYHVSIGNHVRERPCTQHPALCSAAPARSAACSLSPHTRLL